MNNLLRSALNYYNLGWNVIPIPKGQKWPLIPWKRYQDERVTLQEIYEWFKDPNQNIAIVTGPCSGLSVLDADSIKAGEGLASPLSVKTPRGQHFYYKYNAACPTTTKIGGKDDVDTRSHGGIILAPPSDGYSWTDADFSLASLPEFPIHMLSDRSQPTSPIQPRTKGRINDILNSLSEGSRNNDFTKVVGLLHYNNIVADDIIALLTSHAERSNFPLSELRTIVSSVTRYENKKQGPEGEEGVLNVADFLQDKKETKWICDGVIAEQAIGFMAGLPETGKTWLMMDLAIEAARGGTWLGKFQVKQTKVLFIDQERFKTETQRRFDKLLRGKSLKNVPDLFVQCGTTTRLNLEDSYGAFRRKLDRLNPQLVIIDSFSAFHTVNAKDQQSIQSVLEKVKLLRSDYGCTVLFLHHEGKSILNPELRGETPTSFDMLGSVALSAVSEFVLTVRKEKDNLVNLYHTKSTLGPSVPPLTISVIDTPDGGILVKSL